MLKLLYPHYPTILKGMEDLAQKLQHITLQRGQKAFTGTSDIVTYYLNITVKQAVLIILRMFMEYATREVWHYKDMEGALLLKIGRYQIVILKWHNTDRHITKDKFRCK
jgi:hypothetical protein